MTIDDFENKLLSLILAAAKAKLPPQDVADVIQTQLDLLLENAETQKK